MLNIVEIYCENNETKKVIPANLKILFKPEFTDGGTKVSFTFTNKGGNDIMNAWKNAKDTSEDMMGIDNYESFALEESNVQLIVNGKEIPLIDNADSMPMEVITMVSDNGFTSDNAGFTITFAPFDYENAKSVAVKVKTDDGVKKFALKK